MTTMEASPEDMADNDQKPCGHGRMLRKEDPRFIRGRGNYVDDIKLPGMLHLAILRSPYAHARINSIDVTAAQAHPKVKAVVTGADLAEKGLAWMPTLSNDVQAVLATDKVRFQGQEVAFVVAEDHYSARDALELIDVDYDALDPGHRRTQGARCRCRSDPHRPRGQDRQPLFRLGDRRRGGHRGRVRQGRRRRQAGDRVSARASRTDGNLRCRSRSRPGHRQADAVVDDAGAARAPHALRVGGGPARAQDPGHLTGHRWWVRQQGADLPRIRVRDRRLAGAGKPVKWMEDRSENLTSTGFARDYIMVGEIAATKDGKILAIRSNVLADHGAFNGTAAPVKYPAGFFGVFTGSYDIEAAYCHMTAVYTNKAPGGVAYACSFRITEAVYFVERLVDCLAFELKMDPAQLRLQNLLKPDQFPYKSKTGWVYDSGDYETTMRKAMEMIGYDALRAEQKEKRERGELMGIGMSFFTEAVGAGPRKDMDILGLGMADGCELRVHPTGKAVVRLSVQTQGQGHETTFAQIVAEELGIPPDDIDVVHGDTDQTPFGLGTYGSRSTPVSGAAAALVARKVRDKAKIIASGMLEASIADLEWEKGSFHVKGDPSASVTIQDIAMRAHGAGDLPDGLEGGLDAQICYNPENLTYPYGAYFCVVDIDPGTAVVKVRRFLAVDDCGTRINPMIIEGQVHGGITDGIGMALMEIIAFDEEGNCLGGSLMDYLIPTAVEVPHFETGHTVTPSPHHPIGAKGVGESATVGSPPAVVNAVVDALAPFGVRHADMPLTPSRVWEAMQGRATPPI